MFLDLDLGSLHEPVRQRTWDREEVRRRCRTRIAAYARFGLRPGDRVFLHHGNTLEFLVDLLAIWSLGGCAVPIDPRLTGFEVETLARSAVPRLSLWAGSPDPTQAARLTALGSAVMQSADVEDAGGAPPAADPPGSGALELDRDALILFTSGTTGQPKGVVHTHRSLRARWVALRDHLGVRPFRRTLCLLPTHFGHGLICNCLFPWLSGQDLFVLPPFRADVIPRLGSLIDEHEISFLSSVPTLWRLALKTARPPERGTLERVFCGSAPLSAHLWQAVRDWAGTQDVWNAYGITETGSWLAGTSVEGFEPADGLVGEAWGGVVRVVRRASTELPPQPEEACAAGESGYVWVQTPALMRGYLDRPDLTAGVTAAGWFLTGDIGVVDERGWLFLRGREREEINKGGVKVYPGDVDAVAERFEATLDVCTFAIDDPLQGEDVGMAVVLQDADQAKLQELNDWMARHLAKHQMPRRVYLVDEIPRTSRGKINRAQVASRCAGLAPEGFE